MIKLRWKAKIIDQGKRRTDLKNESGEFLKSLKNTIKRKKSVGQSR